MNEPNTQTQDPGINTPPAGAGTPPADPGAGTPPAADKTFTAEDVAKQISDAQAEWEKDSEAKIADAVKKAKEEAETRAKLSDDEKAKVDLQKQQEELSAKEKALALKEIRMDAAVALTEKSLPAEAIDFVLGTDAKSTTENIDKFSKIFTDAVQKAVETRLKGQTPPGGGGSGTDTSKMTDEEFYKWQESQKK